MPPAYKSPPNLNPKALNSGIEHRWTPHKADTLDSTKQDHENWHIPVFPSSIATHSVRNTMLQDRINKHVQDCFSCVIRTCMESCYLFRNYETLVWSCKDSDIMCTNFMWVSIGYAMDNNSPCNHLVVAINMPKVIWSRDMILCPFLLLSNLFSQPLS